MIDKKFNKIKEYSREIYTQQYLDYIQVNDKKLIDKLLSKYFNEYIVSIFKTSEDILASVGVDEIDFEFDYYNKDLNRNYFKENLLISLVLTNILLYFVYYLNIFNLNIPYLKYIILAFGILFLFIRTVMGNLYKKYYKNQEFLKIVSRYSIFNKIIEDDYFTAEELQAIKEIRLIIKEVEDEVYAESNEYKKEVQIFIESSGEIETRYISLPELLDSDRDIQILGTPKSHMLETQFGQKFLTDNEELYLVYLDSIRKPNYFEIIKVVDSSIDTSAIKIESKIIDNFRVNTTIILDKQSFQELLKSRNIYIKRNSVTTKLINKYSDEGWLFWLLFPSIKILKKSC